MSNYFRGSTEKDAVGYRCGETIRFNLELVHDGTLIPCPLFKWEIHTDDGQHTSGMEAGDSGKITLDAVMNKPGFVHVIVTACSMDGKPIEGIDKFEGGAGANIDDIPQGVADPEDFDSFWESQLAKLYEVEPKLLSKVEVDSGNPKFAAYDVRVECLGIPVSGIITMPKDAAPKSLQGRMTYHGYGYAGSLVCCDPNAVVFDVNIHGHENMREQEYYEEYAKAHGGFGFNKTENQKPETCYFLNVILRDIQGVRYLRTLPEYDGKGIYINGGSMGAMQSVSVAAHIGDAAHLEIGVPWMCDLGGITVGRLRGWRPDFDNGIRYFDTASQAARVRCPVRIVCGLGDYVCPPSTEVVLFHNFKTEKSIEFVQNMTHPYRPIEKISYTR